MVRGLKNETFIFLSIISFVATMSSCNSTRVLDNGISTTEIRNGISELEREEFETERIKHELEATSDELDNVIRESSEHYRTIDELLQQIRKQPID